MPENDKPTGTSTTNEEKGKVRPPDGKILALLVGIDTYPHIKELSGCVSDINQVESFLTNRFGIPEGEVENSAGKASKSYAIPEEGYSSLEICRVTNEDATYKNIITTFRTFLGEATAADKVWFHFSGHGTESPTAEEFKNLESGKDQCLMCFDAKLNSATSTYDNILADKEIAVLLNEIATSDGGAPHIVVSFDSCHSGGATRDASLTGVRQTEEEANASERLIESYLDGHYKKLIDQGKKPVPPTVPHVFLGACTNTQLALEADGGYFTNALLNTLNGVGGKISYSDLLIHVRDNVKQLTAGRNHKQTPQFEIMGGAKAYSRFLEGTPEDSTDKYQVFFENGWKIRCGRVNGLPNAEILQEIIAKGGTPTIEIHNASQPNVLATKASLKLIGSQVSTLELDTDLPAGDNIYFGMFDYFPATPEYALINLPEEAKAELVTTNTASGKLKANNIYLLDAAHTATPHSLEVGIIADKYVVKDAQTGKTFTFQSTDAVFEALVKIANFRRLVQLNNPDSNLLNKIDLSVKLESKDNSEVPFKLTKTSLGNHMAITALKSNSNQPTDPKDRIYDLNPIVTIEDNTNLLHVYLFVLDANYGIINMEEKKSTKTIDYSTLGAWGLIGDEMKNTITFKAIITPKEMDAHMLAQTGITSETRSSGFGAPIKRDMVFDDWCAITLTMDIERTAADKAAILAVAN